MADKFIEAKGNIGKMGDIPASVHLKFENLSSEEIIDLWIKWAHAQQATQEAPRPSRSGMMKSKKVDDKIKVYNEADHFKYAIPEIRELAIKLHQRIMEL